MKRDKKIVVPIVIVFCVISGVLLYFRPPEAEKPIPYLLSLDSSLREFGEGKANEFYSFESQQKPDKEIISIENFIEKQHIVEEYEIEKQIEPVLRRDESTDYTSFCLSLKNNVNGNAPEEKIKEIKSSDKVFSTALQDIKAVNNNHHVTHIIIANDNLYDLAKRYYNDGSKWREIYKANRNKMKNPNSLKIGQELLIPSVTVSSKKTESQLSKHNSSFIPHTLRTKSAEDKTPLSFLTLNSFSTDIKHFVPILNLLLPC